MSGMNDILKCCRRCRRKMRYAETVRLCEAGKKLCGKCRKVLPLHSFSIDKRKPPTFRYSFCRDCHKKTMRPYMNHRKEMCEGCGFAPEHPCQLDVHHIDRDHNNTDAGNMKTLCANCHRLTELEPTHHRLADTPRCDKCSHSYDERLKCSVHREEMKPQDGCTSFEPRT